MKPLASLETTLANLYAKLPNLPASARRWIAVNSWWIVLVIAIISSLFLLFAIPAIFALATVASYASIYAYSTLSAGVEIVNAIVTLALGLVSLILLYAAISPLRALRHRGWVLLFLNELIGIVSLIVSFIITIQSANVFGLIWGLVLAAVELYFLFQIRSEFGAGRAVVAKAKAVEADVVDEPVVK